MPNAATQTQQQETIKGRLDRVFAEKGPWFAGLLVIDEEANETAKISGVYGTQPPPIGSELQVTGKWEDKGYGPQLKFSACVATLPSTREGVVRYLCTIDGIGPKRAEEIYDRFGEKCIDIIETDPERLKEIKGMTRWVDEAGERLKSKAQTRHIEQTLCAMKFGERTRAKIMEKYGDKLRSLLEKNPYRLVEVERVSFRQVDNAVMGLGTIPPHSPYRAAAAVVQALKEAADNDKHTWLEEEKLRETLSKLKVEVAVPSDAITAGLSSAVTQGMICRVDGDSGYALASLAKDEEYVAAALAKMLRKPLSRGDVSNVPDEIRGALEPDQLAAVKNAVENRVSILTGGPGTGKTYTEQAIIPALGADDLLILAPTGKAARRANEVTGHDARTIHLFALSNISAWARHDEYGDEKPSEPRTIIIDEFSMVSIDVLAMLLQSIRREDLRLVLIGDIDQLPSVGPGRCLADLIECGKVPTVRLTKIMRQAEGSAIVKNAHAINRGEDPSHKETQRKDWYFVTVSEITPEGKESQPTAEAKALAARIPTLVARAAENFGLNPRRDIQVLAGQRNGALGVNALNDLLRERLNPPGPEKQELRRGEWVVFRTGDKVLCTRNDYDLGVVNGDVGEVATILPEEQREGADGKLKKIPERVVVSFDDGRRVTFEGEKTFDLKQAWAMTVHKSQGSEYPMVIFAMHHSMSWACQRKLFYTGVTRAKERIVIVGSHKAVKMAVKNDKQAERYSRLGRLIVSEMQAAGQ